ncbi:MAG: glutamyl-tRNA reductase [Rhodospirillales bacterium]
MADAATGRLSVFVAGVNQRTASLSLRDQLFVEDERVPALLARLRDAALTEAMLLVTCDRIEVLGSAPDPLAAADRALAVLAGAASMAADDLSGRVIRVVDQPAVRHVFRVAASLESTVIGEPHILGQIKASFDASRKAGCSGPGLEALVQAALATAKRVQSETGIGRRPVSAAAAAIERARSVHGDLAAARALIVGAGEMGELIGASLRGAGLVHLSVTHPRPGRAEAMARALAAHVVPFAELADALVAADIVIGSLGRRQHTIGFEAMRAALKRRRQRSVLLVDVAVPGDVDPAIDRLESAFVYTFDDLERVAEDGRLSREAAAATASRLIDEAVAAFVADRAGRAAAPVVTLLRGCFEAQRQAVLLDAGGDADKATRLLVNRLLHGPTRALRRLVTDGGEEEAIRLETLIRRLFEVADDADDDGEAR